MRLPMITLRTICLADVQTVLNSDTSDDDGNAQTEDAQSEDQSATDSQTATDEAQTATYRVRSVKPQNRKDAP